MEVFRQLKNQDGEQLVDNNRSPQPLYGRPVYHHHAEGGIKEITPEFATYSKSYIE